MRVRIPARKKVFPKGEAPSVPPLPFVSVDSCNPPRGTKVLEHEAESH
jgi:hypothetical protein